MEPRGWPFKAMIVIPLLLLLLSTGSAEITAYDDDNNIFRCVDVPGDFGMVLDSRGIKGRLQVPSDIYGCSGNLTIQPTDDGLPVFFLIQRSPSDAEEVIR